MEHVRVEEGEGESLINRRKISFSDKHVHGKFLSDDLVDNSYMVPPLKKPRFQNNPFHTERTNTTRDLISHLPDECIFEIFRFLPSSRDRCSCAAVSKKWLVLQANMRSFEFKSNSKHLSSCCNKVSRCLEGKKANDTRLAAIAVGIYARGGLGELCIRGSRPSQGITDFGLTIIAQACPTLKSLVLWDCLNVGNKGLESIAHGCKSLEKLEVVNSPLIGDWGLIAIAKNCQNLSTLNLESCPLIGHESLEAFARCSLKLESLSLVKCVSADDRGIISIITKLLKLAKLKLAFLRVRDGVFEAIGKNVRSLRSLCLENISGIGEIGFCSIGLLERLEFLSLKSCSGLNDTSFKAIGNGFVALKQISVRNCHMLTDEGLKELTRSTAMLETLNLEDCNRVTWSGLMDAFTNCSKKLKVLSLVKCGGIEEDPSSCRGALYHPKNLPSLQSVTLKKCRGIGDAFLSWIGSACEQVKHLALVGLSCVTDKGVVAFSKSLKSETKTLVSVDLSGCSRITDLSVSAITSVSEEKLRSLRLDGCEWVSDRSLEMIASGYFPNLVELDLSRCRISDGGLFCLAKSKYQRVEVLSLAGCLCITDQSLRFIETMMSGSLVGLNLKGCPRLKMKGIDSLRETLWWCDVLY